MPPLEAGALSLEHLLGPMAVEIDVRPGAEDLADRGGRRAEEREASAGVWCAARRGIGQRDELGQGRHQGLLGVDLGAAATRGFCRWARSGATTSLCMARAAKRRIAAPPRRSATPIARSSRCAPERTESRP